MSQEKLYKFFYPYMYSLCKNYFDEPHDIVTAINNGMMKVFKTIDQYDSSKGQLQNWVYTSVKNAALTLIRDNKTQHPTKNYKEITDDIEADLKDIKSHASFANEPIVMLQQLSPTTRTICNLFYLEEYSIKEIAATLAIKEGTIKWHLSEGRMKLKTIFNNSTSLQNAK
jgi:RNA polymerase sigma factor (sigma-70 family)